jgi:hypothetical protein
VLRGILVSHLHARDVRMKSHIHTLRLAATWQNAGKEPLKGDYNFVTVFFCASCFKAFVEKDPSYQRRAQTTP